MSRPLFSPPFSMGYVLGSTPIPSTIFANPQTLPRSVDFLLSVEGRDDGVGIFFGLPPNQWVLFSGTAAGKSNINRRTRGTAQKPNPGNIDALLPPLRTSPSPYLRGSAVCAGGNPMRRPISFVVFALKAIWKRLFSLWKARVPRVFLLCNMACVNGLWIRVKINGENGCGKKECAYYSPSR